MRLFINALYRTTPGILQQIVHMDDGFTMINFALNVPDEVWQSRLHASDAAALPDYPAADEQFNLIMRYFTEPGTDEGFKVVGYG
ncbi:hypothetical protein [Erwinia sp. ErVv1]|uniref:hypothetical protein n=1 Tax=Erwinia sp. ErVv1 TaxID=1603299 RepID=UPI0012E774EE|nr:hypothetical protein [Erwinia sp. ErVv1]